MIIVLAEPHPAADKSKTHGINGTRPTTHLRVDDIDARYAALRNVALFAPERTQWGTRPRAVDEWRKLMSWSSTSTGWPTTVVGDPEPRRIRPRRSSSAGS